MDCIDKTRWYLIAEILVVFLLVGVAWGEELILPDQVFFHQSVASAFGQGAVWANPAALSQGQTGDMVIVTHQGMRLFHDWGGAVTFKFFGTAQRHLHLDGQPDLHDYIIAFGVGKQTSLGGSYRYLKGGPSYLNKRHIWTAGFIGHISQKINVGLRAENLNRDEINGVQSDIRYVYGIAAPFLHNLTTVSFEVDMTGKENLDKADFRTGLELRPRPGVYIYADCDNHSRFNLGFRLNIGAAYVGHYHNFDSGGKSMMGTSYFGSVTGRQPTPF